MTPRLKTWRGRQEPKRAAAEDSGNPSRPHAPLNILTQVAEGLWITKGFATDVGDAATKQPLPPRMTVVRLTCGDLWLHAPIQPTGDLVRALNRLGHVRFLVAPNRLHNWWIPQWQALFPHAPAFGAPSSNYDARPSMLLQHVLSENPPSLWALEIGHVVVRTGRFTEVGFFHRASRTLILTDAIERLECARVRPWWRTWLTPAGAGLDKMGALWGHLQPGLRDRRIALRQAVETMIEWRPRRLIVAHGQWYRTGALAELKRAGRWAPET